MKKSFITVALALFVSFFITFTFACSTTVEEPAPEEAKTEQQEEKKTESPASNGGSSGGTSQGGGSNPTGGTNGGGQTPQTPESGTPQPPAPVINYTVTFMSNCETATGATNSITAAENTNITLTANGFIREGYTFTGWNTSADGTGTGYAESSTIKLTGNLILYAQWILATVPTYSVAINEVEHGTVAVSQAVAEAGTQISITVTPDELYAFNTLNLTAADETVITPVVDSENANQYTFTMPEQNVTLSVSFVYIAHSITVSSVENGTVSVSRTAAVAGSDISVTLAPNSEYMLNSISVTSGNGNAITTTVNSTNSNLYTFTMPNENVTVIVTYKLTPYTVTFVTDCSVQVPPQTVERNAKATAVTMNNNSECRGFLGWYTEPECINRFKFDNELTGNIRLYAKWQYFINVTSDNIVNKITSLNYSCGIRVSGVFDNMGIREINTALKQLYTDKQNIKVSLYFGKAELSELEDAGPSSNPRRPDKTGYSFYDCKNLQLIELPKTISSIGEKAFYGCSALENVTYYYDPPLQEIKSYAFAECVELTNIRMPTKVNKIGRSAFYHCKKLRTITIPNGVEEIGAGVFDECIALCSISLPNGLKKIGDCAFYRCEKLTEMTIPNDITEIAISAFYGCKAITSITIPRTEWQLKDRNGTEIDSMTVTENNMTVVISKLIPSRTGYQTGAVPIWYKIE